MDSFVDSFVCTCVRVYVCTCVRVYVCTCVRVYVYVCVCGYRGLLGLELVAEEFLHCASQEGTRLGVDVVLHGHGQREHDTEGHF